MAREQAQREQSRLAEEQELLRLEEAQEQQEMVAQDGDQGLGSFESQQNHDRTTCFPSFSYGFLPFHGALGAAGGCA